MQARIEARAPGFGDLVGARRVLGPHELEARNANLIGGAVNGGTSQLHQELVFRPVPAMRGRAATGVPGLYLGSASAHPGGGVHGAAGANAARAALWQHRLRSLPSGRSQERRGDREDRTSAPSRSRSTTGCCARASGPSPSRSGPRRSWSTAPGGTVLELCAGAGHIGLLAAAMTGARPGVRRRQPRGVRLRPGQRAGGRPRRPGRGPRGPARDGAGAPTSGSPS